jgi:D-alanyl-D-alanine carboxypeptidase
VAAPPFVVRHKTGAVTGVRNDAGLVTRVNPNTERDETLAICVFTRDVRDERWTPANAGCEAVAQIAKLACDHFFASSSGSALERTSRP